MLLSSNCVESVTLPFVTDDFLERIFEIEQDMWARGIWEYLKCWDCSTIYSKKDLYGKWWTVDIDSKIRIKTIKEIEQHLWGIPHDCWDCGGKLQHVYDRDLYLPEIEARYTTWNAFLTVSRDKEGKIVGFMDGYISSLDDIFTNELKYHFTPDVIDLICEKYKVYRDQKLLTVSSIGTDEENKSLFTTLALLKDFFSQFDNSYDNISGLVESIVWSSTYCIFSIMWAQRLQISKKPNFIIPNSQKQWFKTDILFQRNVIGRYKNNFNVRVRDVVEYSRNQELQAVA